MKKLILLILIPLLLLTLSGCFVASSHLEIGEAARIELRNGDGAAAEVTDKEDVRHITENINTLRFEKVHTEKAYDSFAYSISWYGPDGGLMDEMQIISGNRVKYNGELFDSLGATVDTVFLDGILEGR